MQKILIVEDEAKLARYLELELTHEGYETRTARDGRAAVAMHYRNDYCHFPVTDCAEFVKETHADTLPNAVEVFKGALAGCYVMEI